MSCSLSKVKTFCVHQEVIQIFPLMLIIEPRMVITLHEHAIFFFLVFFFCLAFVLGATPKHVLLKYKCHSKKST